MAWPLAARHSRALLAALVVAHLLVISGQVDGGGGASLLQRGLLTLLSPFQAVVGGALRGVIEAWRGYLDLRRVREDNRRLGERVEVLELLLQEKQDRVREGERLRELLGMRQATGLPTVAAEVVARQGLPWFRSVTVNQGLSAGVAVNAAALSAAGVVGRVVAAGPRVARVQLLLDRDCSVGVVVERSRVTGVVQGQVAFAESGTTDLIMKYVPALADVVDGDAVVTSGLDGIYPKGLLVGHVRSVGPPGMGLFRDVLVTPSVAFDRVEEILLVTGPREDRSLTVGVR
jgi:rod shape-determining protein MreC